MIKKVKKGFTLIELVVVIAVIAILSAVSVVAYVGITNSAKKSAAQQEADQIAMTVRAAALTNAEGYKDETDKYTVIWTKDGLTFKKEAGSAMAHVSDIIKDMYEDLEEVTLSAEIACASDFENSALEVAEVKSFTYTSESNVEVTAYFVK